LANPYSKAKNINDCECKKCRNEHFQTNVVNLLIITVVISIWYSSQAVLNTSIPPAIAVISSMDTISNNEISIGTSFSRALQVGDLIIIRDLTPHELNTDYPNSDNSLP
jgi:hypothetical protein